jgi:hypothetical protein
MKHLTTAFLTAALGLAAIPAYAQGQPQGQGAMGGMDMSGNN